MLLYGKPGLDPLKNSRIPKNLIIYILKSECFLKINICGKWLFVLIIALFYFFLLFIAIHFLTHQSLRIRCYVTGVWVALFIFGVDIYIFGYFLFFLSRGYFRGFRGSEVWPMGESFPWKIFGILFWLETSKNY